MIPQKVIHVPLEIAGQVGLICESYRSLGYFASAYNFFPNYLKYDNPYMQTTDIYELIKLLEPATQFYDLFHFHNSYTFLQDKKDIELIKAAGKKMVMHHRGNDVRSRTRARQGKDYTNPYVNADCSFPDEQIEQNLKYFAKHMACAIVQDYELYKYVIDYYQAEGKPVFVLPRLIKTSSFSPLYPKPQKNQPLQIVHAPTNRAFKGSDAIEQVINQLKSQYPIEYKSVEGLTHQQALEIYKRADIVIDQILCGAYGNLSVEAMALGKPVICYIRPDLVSHYPQDLPIISANPDTLYAVLQQLLKHPEQLYHLGQKGRQYVEKHHEASKVIQELLQIYQHVYAD